MSVRRTRFYVDKRNRKWLGVCAGLADYTGVDVTLVRVGVVLLTVIGGFPWTLIAYWVINWVADDKPRELAYDTPEVLADGARAARRLGPRRAQPLPRHRSPPCRRRDALHQPQQPARRRDRQPALRSKFMDANFIFPLTVLAIPILAIVARSVNRLIAFREKQLLVTSSQTAEIAAQYAAKTERLEQRVAVLERILTDRSANLAEDIERLRDAPLN